MGPKILHIFEVTNLKMKIKYLLEDIRGKAHLQHPALLQHRDVDSGKAPGFRKFPFSAHLGGNSE